MGAVFLLKINNLIEFGCSFFEKHYFFEISELFFINIYIFQMVNKIYHLDTLGNG